MTEKIKTKTKKSEIESTGLNGTLSSQPRSSSLSRDINSRLIQNVIQTQLSDQSFQILESSDQVSGHVLEAEALQTLEGIVITVTAPPGFDEGQTEEFAEKIWQVVPTSGNSNITHIIAVGQSEACPVIVTNEADSTQDFGIKTEVNADTLASMLLSNPVSKHQIPDDAPTWALKLRDCEAIGYSYRGWVASEPELELILTFHKQQTQTYWGTRQSPSNSRQSTRLMWKSQYVPFDGIPFINAGSRAIVMECQYGPRRKGHPVKKQGDNVGRCEFKQTCPARIYIKKVRKYPHYAVDMQADRKNLRIAMDRAFQELKNRGFEGHGEDRWYVQLPNSAAHEFHDSDKATGKKNIVVTSSPLKIMPDIDSDDSLQNGRMHPKLIDKIRELVQAGESRVYVIRKQLRKLVERGMIEVEQVPERHNLCYFPTVHDIQNHIFQALKDVENGDLMLLPTKLNLDSESDDGNSSDQVPSEDTDSSVVSKLDTQLLWPTILSTANNTQRSPLPESVTLTFTQPEQGAGQVISRIETHMSDGSLQISTSLTPETVQLLSRFHPEVFNSGVVQLLDPNLLPGISLTSPNTTESETEKADSECCELPNLSLMSDIPEIKAADPVSSDENSNVDTENRTTLKDGKDGSIIVTMGEGGEILHIQRKSDQYKPEQE